MIWQDGPTIIFFLLQIIWIVCLHSNWNTTLQSFQHWYLHFYFTMSFFYSLYLFLVFPDFFCLSLCALFWKWCQHCCFYTKRLLLSDGWRQPQLQRRACVCLAAEGRSHWKGQNCEALLVTAMKTRTSTNSIAISNNAAQFFLSDFWWGKSFKMGMFRFRQNIFLEKLHPASPHPLFFTFFFSLSLSPFLSHFNPVHPSPNT